MRQRIALVGLVAGIALAIGPAAAWLLGGSSDVAAGPAFPGPPPAVEAVVAVPSGPVAASAPSAPPLRIRVPGAGVDAPVVATGVDDRGRMAVPEDVRTVGWYRFGSGPGAATGSAVLAGHVDDRVQGLGVFHRLDRVQVGGPVEVTLADGAVVTYRIDAVERVAKAALPADRLFARDGPPRLALITCGGDFDTAEGAYTDNVVVTAVAPIGS